MKKSKLAMGVAGCLVSVIALASCSNGVTAAKDGSILTYNGVNYSADDLFGNYNLSSEGAETMFNSVYKVAVRNYFNEGQPGAEFKEDIQKKAKNDVSGLKADAKSNAETNGTTYESEFEKLLKEKGAEDEDELFDVFEYDLMEEKFNNEFYEAKIDGTTKTNVDILRDGGKLFGSEKAEEIDGYLKEKSPYHVKHILVKVDASNNNHTSAAISAANAEKIERVVSDLAEKTIGFGRTANALSDDTGSAANYGELDIMDRDLNYVNEFKLGVYLYDTLFNGATSADARANLNIPEEDLEFFENQGIGQIPYGEVLRLANSSTKLEHDPYLTKGIADVTTDSNGAKVVNDNSALYPRNVIFNKYFNNHNIAVITPNNAPSADQLYSADETTGALDKVNSVKEEAYVGTYNEEFAALPGFNYEPVYENDLANTNFVNNDANKVLRDEKGNVILAVRAGTAGESGYQGIHFIVVERSPFVANQNDTTLSEYWTYKYPTQDGYPQNGDKEDKDTYVNFFNKTTSGYKDRATTVSDKIKGYNPKLNSYIYKSLINKGDLKFGESEAAKMVENTINVWIEAGLNKVEFDNNKTWNETWRTYNEYIEQANIARGQNLAEFPGAYQLVSERAVAEFQNPNKGKSWTVSGGLCYAD